MAQLMVDYVADALAEQMPGRGVFDVIGAGLTIGRLPQCDIQINLPGVSRRHARIDVEGGRCYVSDLDSTNGTFVNSVQLAPQERRCLTNGDLVQIGAALVLRFADTARTAPDTRAQPYLSGRIWLDRPRQQVYLRRQRLEPCLSLQQFRLLDVIMSAGGRVVTRDQLAAAVWPEAQGEVSEAMIDNLVARVRQRLGGLDPGASYIATVRGAGYRFTGDGHE
jgi:DNA-binding response OmpR family regulator